MDEFGNDIISKIKRNHVQEVKIHGVVGKDAIGDFIDTAVF